MPALPNFIIIGAAKCGTTSLAHYLGQHPDVQVSNPKEINYFNPRWRERIAWYESHFDPDVPRRGEASVSYTMFAESEGAVPERIQELVPDVKLIYLVGDPLERIISQWIMWHTKEEDRDFARSKDAGRPLAEILDEDPLNPYVYPSRYASRLRPFLDRFGEEHVLVLDQEDLRGRTQATLAEVFSFLNVDDSYESPEFGRRLNASRDWRRARPGYARLRRAVMAAGAERLPRSLTGVVGGPLRRAFSDELVRPSVDGVVDDKLRESLRDEVDELRAMTGKEFAGWSI